MPRRTCSPSAAFVAVTVALWLGCGGDEGADGGVGGQSSTSGPGGSGETVGGGGGPVDDTAEVSIGPFDVAPGEEQTMCVIVDAGNEAAGMLRTIRTHLTDGSHHLIVTKIDDGVAQPSPTPCGAFAHGGDALFIAEKHEAALTYPDGTGLPFAAHQLIGLEMHYINVSSQPLAIEGVVELELVADGAALKEVALLFEGDLDIYIPAQSMQTFSSQQGVPAGANVFALTSHTHQLGTYASIRRDGPNGELLHESQDWSDPPLDTFTPALTFAPGETLFLTCSYDNTTDQDVSFGTDFHDEMCFLWAHYYLD